MSHSTHTKAAAAPTSAELVADAKALADKITAMVGPAPALTLTDVQRSAKLRKGGEKVIQTIASLSNKVGLVVPSAPTATIVEKLGQAQDLAALHTELVTATKHVADAIFVAESQSWAGATVHYSMLRRLGTTDGSIAKALQPAVQFFASRSAAATEQAKESRGGARKGSAKAKAFRANKRAEDAQTIASSESQAASVGAPAAASQASQASQGGAPTSSQATVAPGNGAAH